MTSEQHKSYLASLEKSLEEDPNSLVAPKKEGAFYFGDDVTLSEYIEKYRNALERGLV